ncbi:MAG: lamin tail domain-containing protein [Verrucomicrobiales bacterium]
MFTTLPDPPAVENGSATDILAFSATLGANVTANGGETPEVRIYYGTADGGTDAGSWADSALAGTFDGAGSVPVSGLAQGATVSIARWRRIAAARRGRRNRQRSPPQCRVPPLSPTKPPPASGRTPTALRAEVTENGADPLTITFYYGPADGGTNPAAWAHSALGCIVRRCVLAVRQRTSPWDDVLFHRLRRECPRRDVGVPVAALRHGCRRRPALSSTKSTTMPSRRRNRRSLSSFSTRRFEEVDLSGWILEGGIDYAFPGGTTLPPGGYLVIAEDLGDDARQIRRDDPAPIHRLAEQRRRGDPATDAAGSLIDAVDYAAGFLHDGARGTSSSMELVNLALDNDLGSSCRSSGLADPKPLLTYVAPGESWHYRKGLSEASSPADAWRAALSKTRAG